MPPVEGLTVGEVARIAGVTVRTLHHWESVGLLVPGARTAAGYRVYDAEDLGRLTRVLTYRELGLSLEQVARLLDDPATDAVTTLRRQHRLLVDRIARLQQLAALVQTTMEARSMGIDLTPGEVAEVFGSTDPAGYAAETEQRWGDSDAWRQSHARTSGYGKDDWVRVRAEGADVERRFAEALAAGEPADGAVARGLAEEHRRHICRSYYDCTPALHLGLADLYTGDERFRAHYEELAPGLAEYVAAAIRAGATH